MQVRREVGAAGPCMIGVSGVRPADTVNIWTYYGGWAGASHAGGSRVVVLGQPCTEPSQ